MNQKSIAIIGAGAAGMMAGISTAKKGNKVTIFEKNSILGKKILLTGNGRCNVANTNVSYSNYFGQNPKFCASVFARFSNQDTINFFEDLGLILNEEDNGRLFPRSNQAQSIIDVLEYELKRLGVQILLNQKIKNIEKKDNKFILTTFQEKNLSFDKVIITTGGKTFPKTGSTGDGFRFAQNLGHKIIEPFPASTPFRIKSIICNKLQGVKVIAELKIFYKGKCIIRKTDELLFTHFGISAPVVLSSSRIVSKILTNDPDAKLECSINFFPEYSQEQLFQLLQKRTSQYPDKIITNQFIGLLPKKVAPIILEFNKIDTNKESRNVSKKEIFNIIQILTSFRMPILGLLGWDQAQFTAGGVDTREIDSKTMESKIVPGLYFAGEVVDIDGESGGYNLQWAWSSGYVAGSSI